MASTFPIAIGDQGLFGGHNLARIVPEYLLKAENIAFDDGCIRKEGGAAIYNTDLPAAWTESANPKNIALNGIAYNGTVLVAVGAADGTDSYIVTSTDQGQTWTERAPTVAKNIALNAVCWSSSLSLFVAVGVADGTDAYILTSPDGTTWTERANPKNFALNGVIARTTGNFLVAVGAADGTDAYIVTSTDGITWTERTNPKNFGLNKISSIQGNVVLAGGAADGTDGYLLTSVDGATWVERTNPKNFAFNAAGVTTNNPGTFAAVGVADGTDAYIVSSNAIAGTYTERTNPKNFALNSFSYNGTTFVAVGAADGTDAYVVTSTDGTTWTEQTNPKNFALNDIVWTGSVFVAVGAADGTDAYIVISSSVAAASTWTERANPKNFALNDIAFDGQTYVAVGASDGSDAYIVTSTDLATWTERSNAENTALNAIIWAGAKYVAVGALSGVQTYSYILNSNDGITWTQRSHGKNFGLNGLAYNGVIMVAVGDADGTDAYIITSQDGKNWTERANPKNFALNSIVWDGDQFVAVGDPDGVDAYIVTSPDGITWTEQANPVNLALYSIEWNGSTFVAAGNANGSFCYLVTSPDAVTWTQQTTPTNVSIFDIVWNGKIFMAVGGANTDTYIIASSDGTTWSEQSTPKEFRLNGVVWDGVNFVAVGISDGADAYMITLDYDQVYVLGATYWNYNGASPKIVALDTFGRLLMDNFDGNFSTILDSGHTVTSNTFPVFVEGGKEVAANNKKLFIFTGANPVQVLSGAGTTTADIATPPADWSAANQPTGGLIHKNRLWGYGNANDPHRLYYSTTASHEDMSGGSLSIYPGEGEKIVNAISYKGYIIVFKYPKGIYVVDTTPVQTTGWNVDRVNEKLGGAGQGSAAVVEEDIVFIDHTGELRLVAGITEFGDIGSRSFSDTHGISNFIRDNYYLPSNTKWRMAYYSLKRELHIGASSNSLGINDNRMVVDFNGMTPRFRNSTRDTCLYLFLRELNGVPELMACDNLGNIWRLDQTTKSKNGQGYNSQFQLTYTDLGLPGVDKAGMFISIDFEPTDTTVAIDVIWDGVYQETTTINLSAELEIQPGRMILTKQVPLNGDGDRVSLTFRNNNAGEDYAIQGLRIIHDGGLAEEEP
jgi:hypothetical protein